MVREVDKEMMGEEKGKGCVGIGVGKGWGGMEVKEEVGDEVRGKNMVMMGGRGVGKSEMGGGVGKVGNGGLMKVEGRKLREVG